MMPGNGCSPTRGLFSVGRREKDEIEIVSQETESGAPITIKKYANRRLYNTATSSYVTLDHLCQMVKDGQDFVVIDAKSGDDITRSVLTQIIFEEESKGQNLLPIDFLRQLITFYGDSMQTYVPSFLQISMEQFSKNQEKFRESLSSALGGQKPFEQFEDQIRQNVSMFEQTMKMFSPFGQTDQSSNPARPEPNDNEDKSDQIDELKDQIDEMKAKLDALAKQKK